MSLTPGVVWKERRERSEDAASCVPSSAAYMKGKLRPVVSLGSLPFESWLIVSPHPCQVGCILDILTMVFMDVWIFEAVSCHSLSTAGLGLFGCAGTGLQVQHAVSRIWGDLSGQQQASIGQTMFLGTCFSSRKKRKAVLKKACMR